jgi:hypothetical protein
MSILSWLQNLFTDPPPKPRPPDWKKTLSDLTAENRSLTGQEIEWAREYEVEQLRSWARFPKNGELYEASHDVKVSYQIDWRAPYGTGGEGILPKGTQIRVACHAGIAEPIAVQAIPVDEKGIEALIIPADDRNSTKYGGYCVTIGVDQLNKDFHLVGSSAGQSDPDGK